MKEITRVITAQITMIARCEEPEEEIISREETVKRFNELVKKNVRGGVDDIVTTVQDFELDVEE